MKRDRSPDTTRPPSPKRQQGLESTSTSSSSSTTTRVPVASSRGKVTLPADVAAAADALSGAIMAADAVDPSGDEHTDALNALTAVLVGLSDPLREAFFTNLDSFMPDLDVDFEDDAAEEAWHTAQEEAPGGDHFVEMIKPLKDSPELASLTASYSAASPFPHGRIAQFVPHAGAYAGLVREVSSMLEFTPKSNDLYDFVQSGELAELNTADGYVWLPKFRDALYDPEFLQLMTSVTGIEFDPSTSDLHALCFNEGDYLALHDDNMPGRRVAYILYLVDEDWGPADGGALDLYPAASAPSTPAPGPVVSLVPAANTFSFFTVSHDSYHAVAQVTSSKTRLSISGWLHGTPLSPKVPRSVQAMVFTTLQDAAMDAMLRTVVAPQYLDPTRTAAIAEAFADASVISLPGFLTADAAAAALSVFPTCPDPAHVTMPPDEGTFRTATADSDAEAMWRTILTSAAFGKLLGELTGLDLGSASGPAFRSFFSGDHTLLHDATHPDDAYGLDVVLDMSTLPALSLAPRSSRPLTLAARGAGPVLDPDTDQAFADPDAELVDRVAPGSLVYTLADQVLFTLPPQFNTLHLVYQSNPAQADENADADDDDDDDDGSNNDDDGSNNGDVDDEEDMASSKVMSFVKHVTVHAGKRNARHDMIAKFR